MIPRLILTTGDSAGVGPDIVLQAAMHDWPAELVAVGCQKTLSERAHQLGLQLALAPYQSGTKPAAHQRGSLKLIDLPLPSPCTPGTLNLHHAGQVLAQLELAVEHCRTQECQAMVTAPVHKGIINEAGIPFSGHTEFLSEATKAATPVMLLVSEHLKMALATTHLPLRAVPDSITTEHLKQVLRTLIQGLASSFQITRPQITILGLNPHAGEGGYLGHEEQAVIAPACEALRNEGLSVVGPIPADTAFNTKTRENTDAYLAMYHDQGLPVIKAQSFGKVVNVTLGLPIVRVSVDHGTALELAGTREAKPDSMMMAIETATELAISSLTES